MQGGEIQFGEARRVEQAVEQRVDAGQRGETGLAQLLDEAGHVARVGDQPVEAAQAGEDQAVRRQRKDVIQRQRGDDHFLAGLDQLGADPGGCLQHVGDHVAVGQHRTLGHAGGAAGVLQESDVVVVHRDRLQRVRCALGQRVAETHRFGQVERRHHLLDVLEHEVDQRALGEAEQVADARGDDVLDLGLRRHLLQRGREIVQHHDRLGAGILQLMLQLACGVHRVGVDHHQPGAQRSEQCDRILQHVGQHDRDAIALAQLEYAGEVAGELAAHFVDLPIAELTAEIGERGTIAETGERLLEHRRDRGILVDVDLTGHAGRIMFQPGTFVAHALGFPVWFDGDAVDGWNLDVERVHDGPCARSLEHTLAYSGKPRAMEFRR